MLLARCGRQTVGIMSITVQGNPPRRYRHGAVPLTPSPFAVHRTDQRLRGEGKHAGFPMPNNRCIFCSANRHPMRSARRVHAGNAMPRRNVTRRVAHEARAGPCKPS